MKKISRIQLIIICVLMFSMAFCVYNVFAFETKIVCTDGWGGAFCPCCIDTGATTFVGWGYSRIEKMACVKCNALVNITRNADLTYTISNSDNCYSRRQDSRSPASSSEEATFVKNKIAVARFSVDPKIRIYAIYKNSDNYWENSPNFLETIATDLEIPWGKKFKLHRNNDNYYLTFDLPDSMIQQSTIAPPGPTGLRIK